MNIRCLNILFSKSGSGSTNTRITLPITWIKEMGLNPEDRQVKVTFTEDKKIIIEKEK